VSFREHSRNFISDRGDLSSLRSGRFAFREGDLGTLDRRLVDSNSRSKRGGEGERRSLFGN